MKKILLLSIFLFGTRSYASIIEIACRYQVPTSGSVTSEIYNIELCAEDSSKECARQKIKLDGLKQTEPAIDDRYNFEVYLTNDEGEAPAINIAVNDLYLTVASRDLQDRGYLHAKVGDNHVIIGCSIKK